MLAIFALALALAMTHVICDGFDRFNLFNIAVLFTTIVVEFQYRQAFIANTVLDAGRSSSFAKQLFLIAMAKTCAAYVSAPWLLALGFVSLIVTGVARQNYLYVQDQKRYDPFDPNYDEDYDIDEVGKDLYPRNHSWFWQFYQAVTLAAILVGPLLGVCCPDLPMFVVIWAGWLGNPTFYLSSDYYYGLWTLQGIWAKAQQVLSDSTPTQEQCTAFLAFLVGLTLGLVASGWIGTCAMARLVLETIVTVTIAGCQLCGTALLFVGRCILSACITLGNALLFFGQCLVAACVAVGSALLFAGHCLVDACTTFCATVYTRLARPLYLFVTNQQHWRRVKDVALAIMSHFFRVLFIIQQTVVLDFLLFTETRPGDTPVRYGLAIELFPWVYFALGFYFPMLYCMALFYAVLGTMIAGLLVVVPVVFVITCRIIYIFHTKFCCPLHEFVCALPTLPDRIRNAFIQTRFLMWFGMKLCRLRNASANIFQRISRGYEAVKKFDEWSKAALKMERVARGFAVRAMIRKYHKTATKIQRITRGMLVQIRLRCQRAAATNIQRMVRGMLVRNELHRQAMATMIQCLARGMIARNLLNNQHAAATSIQSIVRGMLVRMELEMEKAAARRLHAVRAYLRRVAAERRIREQQARIEEEKNRVRLAIAQKIIVSIFIASLLALATVALHA